MFARVARAYSDDMDHAQRIYDYISRLWFMPATPVLSNGGATRGLPISCFLNSVNDDLDGIVGTWTENVWLPQWRRHRHLLGQSALDRREGEELRPHLGHHPVRARDGFALLPSARAPCAAARRRSTWMCIIRRSGVPRNPQAVGRFQPETSTFITASTSPTSSWRRCATIRRSVCWSKTGEVMKEVNARELWQKILETRLNTGRPYLIFADTVNKQMPKHQRDLGLRVTTSNLLARIMLHTGPDHNNVDRTAVCCLSSLNVETWDEWCDDEQFIPTSCVSSTTCSGNSSIARLIRWSAPSTRPPGSGRSVSASWAITRSCRPRAFRSRATMCGRGTSRSTSTSAVAPTPLRSVSRRNGVLAGCAGHGG